MEIGSFIEGTEIFRTSKNSFYELINRNTNSENVCYTCLGREAIKGAICNIEKDMLHINKKCLLPQYTCETVVLPFVHAGWEVEFYPIEKMLNINLYEFVEIVKNVNPSVILFHPYYGMEFDVEIIKFLQSCQKKNVRIIEDLTQALSFMKKAQWSDYRIISLRKWFGIPDGGIFIGKGAKELIKDEEWKTFVDIKLQAQNLKKNYLNGDKTINKEVFLRLNSEAEKFIDTCKCIHAISKGTLLELESIDIDMVLQKRQENADYLELHLKELAPMITVIPREKESPLYYPVFVKNREEIQQYLCKNDIYASVIWKEPEQIQIEKCMDTKYIYEHILALPCDQRYSIEDMDRIIFYINKAVKEIG